MPTSSPSKKVLVADDEKPLAAALSLKLKKAGFDVTTVYDGQAVLDACNKAPFDLIMLDLLMPVADGWHVLEALKDKKIPIIVTSNLSQEEDIQKARSLGAMDFVVKSNNTLGDIVDKAIFLTSTPKAQPQVAQAA